MKTLSGILNYFPSLLSRYYLQLLLIALPWLLQNKGMSIEDISYVISSFFVGSILSSLFFSFHVHKIHLSTWLRNVILLLAIVVYASFMSDNLSFLILIRFVQGCFNGLLRPLSQIWIQEKLGSTTTAAMRSKYAAYAQVYIAIGMAFGAFFGSFFSAQQFGVYFMLSVIFVPAIMCGLYLHHDKESVPRLIEKNEENINFQYLFTWLINNKVVSSAIIIYFFSLVILKIWLVGIPYYLREVSINNGADLLVLLLTVHPLIFAIGQFLMGFFSKRLSGNNNLNFNFILAATISQAIIVWLAILSHKFIITFLLVLLGGGLIPACIYPLLMIIVMSSVKNEQNHLRKWLLFIIALLADIGQLVGSGLLIFINLFHMTLGIMIVPILCCIMVFIILNLSIFFRKPGGHHGA